MRFFEVVVALAIKELSPKLTSRKRRKINSRTHIYLFMKASRVVLHDTFTWQIVTPADRVTQPGQTGYPT